MRLLVDTHVLLWAVSEPAKIPETYRDRIESPDNEVLFSAASIWELAIKMQIGRIALPVDPESIAAAAVRMGFLELPVTAAHAAGIRRLPLHHRDPFDRLLIAQTLHEPARFLTADPVLARYSDLVDVIT
ncbi:MAG: type II toxin-antitoxin system VapC family toxin [Planctomycetes bacterium]|nr:type II toxin-antitoxin system VapC family toxin [Planctomycetota bacterium]